ncbi:uncharacterized protein AB9X84_001093 [Acanthopagrus schlegelii]
MSEAPMITTNNDSCANGNSTCTVMSSFSAGLAVGLTLFVLLLVIVSGVLAFRYHRQIMNILPFRHRRSQKKEDCTETPEADSHQYTGLSREQSTAQAPIYENLSTTRYSKSTVKQSRLTSETEEDLYLQCDIPDDAIYSNDPACNLSILSHPQEEDVYIVPDS